MPNTPLTETDVFSAQVTVPQPGDLDAVASVIAGEQSLANRALWAKNRMFGGTYVLALPTAALDDGVALSAADWAWDAAGFQWFTFDKHGSSVYFQIQLPHLNATAAGHCPRLSNLRIRTKGNGHDGVHLAANAMFVQVKRKDAAGTVAVVNAPKFNDAGPTTIDTVRDWAPLDLAHEIDPLSTYFLQVTNESGANSQSGTLLMRVAIDILAPTS